MTRKIVNIIITSLFLSIASLSNSFAKDSKIAIVDLEQVLKNSSVIKDLDAKLKEKKERIMKDIRKKDSALIQEKNNLDKNRKIMSKEKVIAAEESLNRKIGELTREAQSYEEELKGNYNNSLEKINDKIIAITKEIADDKKFDLVFAKEVTIYNGQNVTDITQAISEKLNKDMASIVLE